MQAIFASNYLPCLAYFACLAQAENPALEACENFQKQTYRNRAYINTANGIDRLTVPVLKANSKMPIRETAIDYSEAWENRHWRAIRSAYAQAPYFEYYADAFMPIIYSKHAYLFDLNLALTNSAMRLLGWPALTNLTQAFQKDVGADFRENISPKQALFIDMPPYYQVFGEEFIPNLSIIDLLFCEGPNASAVLRQAKVMMQ